MNVRRGHRWRIAELGPSTWWWVAWRLQERVEGEAPTEEDAIAAVEHFRGKAIRR